MRRAALVAIGLVVVVLLGPLWWWARGVNGEHRADERQTNTTVSFVPACPSNTSTTTVRCPRPVPDGAQIDYAVLLPPARDANRVARIGSPCSTLISRDVRAAIAKQLRPDEHFVTGPGCGTEVAWALVANGQDRERVVRVRRVGSDWTAEP